MSSTMPVGARELLRHAPFLFFLLSRSLSRFCSQVGAVAIGWQIYDLTGSAFELGMVGLVQFLPTALLVIVPQGSLQRATALSSGAAQLATITGPALGGFAYAVMPSAPYGIMVLFWL